MLLYVKLSLIWVCYFGNYSIVGGVGDSLTLWR